MRLKLRLKPTEAGPGRPAFPQVMAVAVGFETSHHRIWQTNIAPDLVICPSMDPHRSCNYGHECGQIVGTPAGPGPRSRRPGGPDAHQVRHSGQPPRWDITTATTGANRLRDLNAQGAST